MVYPPTDAAFLEALGRLFLIGVALSLVGLSIGLVTA
jgi:hypothetical protein